jgi:plasmid replication initiation protein
MIELDIVDETKVVKDIKFPMVKNVMVGKDLANGRFNLDISELCVILFILGKVSQTLSMEIGTEYSLSVDEYAELRGVHRNVAKEALANVKSKLWNSYITLPSIETGKPMCYRWVITTNLPDPNTLTLIFNPLLYPYLSGLTRYCRAPLRKISKFKHISSYRLYFLILNDSYKHCKGSVAFTPDEFISLLGLEDKSSYSNFADLNRVIIKPAIAELKEKNLISITLVKQLLDRKVVRFTLNYLITLDARG